MILPINFMQIKTIKFHHLLTAFNFSDHYFALDLESFKFESKVETHCNPLFLGLYRTVTPMLLML